MTNKNEYESIHKFRLMPYYIQKRCYFISVLEDQKKKLNMKNKICSG